MSLHLAKSMYLLIFNQALWRESVGDYCEGAQQGTRSIILRTSGIMEKEQLKSDQNKISDDNPT